MPQGLNLNDLRRYAVARSLFAPTGLAQAVRQMGGFVQADPLRAPARAQDLILRHRVRGYRAGDLERRYPSLALQEDFFINYGFLVPELRALMHPRTAVKAWDDARSALANEVLAQVQHQGKAHPAEVDAALQHGSATNWFGGNSRLSTDLLDGLHYRGLLNVVGRDSGTRCYALASPWPESVDPQAAMDAMADALVIIYAPLPAASLGQLVGMLGHAAPQWQGLRTTTLARAKARLAHARVDDVDWYWPAQEDPVQTCWRAPTKVRLLAPFDPVVWDRRRFELLWGWAYRFEAYTPAVRRVRGHYALPLLWRDRVIGWANLKVVDQRLCHDIGYIQPPPAGQMYLAALDRELQAMALFLGVTHDPFPMG
jgi:uncharacterized protein YcaQ